MNGKLKLRNLQIQWLETCLNKNEIIFIMEIIKLYIYGSWD